MTGNVLRSFSENWGIGLAQVNTRCGIRRHGQGLPDVAGRIRGKRFHRLVQRALLADSVTAQDLKAPILAGPDEDFDDLEERNDDHNMK